jgi:hypothetical protein
MTDDELHAAFDLNFKLAPIVRPPESAERTLERLDAIAELNMQTCPWCSLGKGVDRMEGSVPDVVGITHERGCPNAE